MLHHTDIKLFRSPRFALKIRETLFGDFDVLLTVHLSIILVINQLNAQILAL